MPEFLELCSPEDSLKKILDHLPVVRIQVETIETIDSLGRVTGNDLIARESLPTFSRSSVDGFAVRADDTHGAGETQPTYLSLAGEVPMGGKPEFDLKPGLAGVIHTGGMLPAGADAVVMLEHAQLIRRDEVEILRPVAINENVVLAGEDIQPGKTIYSRGRRMRPVDVGGLLGLGITRIDVARATKVGILSSGDEVIPPDADPSPGQVRDINSGALAALVRQAGGTPNVYGIVPDIANVMEAVAGKALAENDIVVITAGSSVSSRDLTAGVVNRLGQPGVLVHGVNIRPGKPTILAVCDGKPVIGLPGNPISALVIGMRFVVPLIHHRLGVNPDPFIPVIEATLTVNVPSLAGREDWVPVQLTWNEGMILAEPIFFKSNLIFNLAQSDGLIRIAPNSTGLNRRDRVQVFPL